MFFKDNLNRIITAKDGTLTHASKPYTPSGDLQYIGKLNCETLGYEPGQFFRTCLRNTYGNAESVVELVRDNGTCSPAFKNERGALFNTNLELLVPLTESQAAAYKEGLTARLSATKRLRHVLSLVHPDAIDHLPGDLFAETCGLPARELESLPVIGLLDQAFCWYDTCKSKTYWEDIDRKIYAYVQKVGRMREDLKKKIEKLGIKVTLPEFILEVGRLEEHDQPQVILRSAFVWSMHPGDWRAVHDLLKGPQKIEMGKAYRTKDGKPLRILCVDRKSRTFPVLALTEDGELLCYTEYGGYSEYHPHNFDLVEVV